jgi:hypothetical protein
VVSLTDVYATAGDNISIPVIASADKTVTFNLGVPNFTSTYGRVNYNGRFT